MEAPDDLVGLLSYALYKQTIREAVSRGQAVLPRASRQPAPTERAAYRGDAERRLELFSASATVAAAPGIIANGLGASIGLAKTEVIQAIHRRTSFATAIGANLAAWAITLAVTVLLLVTVYLPNWQASLIERVRAVQAEAPAPKPSPALSR